MRVVQRERTLRTTTRKESSPYKVVTAGVGEEDLLRLTVFSEARPDRALAVFEFQGSDVAGKDSIHFKAKLEDGAWRLTFGAVKPNAIALI